MRGRIGSVLRAVCTFEVNLHGETQWKKIGKKEKSLSKMAKPEIVRTSSLLAPSLSSRGTLGRNLVLQMSLDCNDVAYNCPNTLSLVRQIKRDLIRGGTWAAGSSLVI